MLKRQKKSVAKIYVDHLVLPVMEVVVEYVQLQRVWILVASTFITLVEEKYENCFDVGKFEVKLRCLDLREDIKSENTFSFGHCPKRGVGGLPMPGFFGPFFTK